MPKGVPRNGVRMTAKRIAQGLTREAILEQKTLQNLYSGSNVIAGYQPMPFSQQPVVEAVEASEEDIKANLSERFSAMDDMVLATALGINRSLIVSGSAGLGKSFGVEKVLEGLSDDVNVKYIKGYCKATGIYRALYENQHANSVIVFDDCDSVFSDDISLNILKGACDSSDERLISWGSETTMKDEEGEALPREFVFEGSIIFLTNYDFEDFITRANKLAPHFEALMSRSLYLDLCMKTQKERLVRIKQVVQEYGMLNSVVNAHQQQVLLEWVQENKNKVRDLSLRTVKKAAILMSTNPNRWESLAKITLCRNV